ncbi:MAG: Trehalose synthase [Rhodospirillales bacterium]|nr:Trehalose synthase [Rhodospirillales bacterium]
MAAHRQSRVISDPQWYKDAIIYQIHVKSFFDGNNDGVGDFVGLLEKLDYISEIGVNTIWLLPFYPSPRRDDGYDIAEYRGVHPEYGNIGDFKRFVDEAHARGIRVITELVINHTSDQHPWFQKARRAKPGSAARNFYVWSDTDRTYANTRIIFCDTEKSNWTWDDEAKAYYWHRFYSHQPDLNFDNPRVIREVLSVMRFWLDLGVDGLRLDAVPYLIEREGTSNENLPETHQILKRIRSELETQYSDRMLLAEANMWPEDAQQYFGDGDEAHMAFNFPLMPRMYMAIAQEDRFPITDIMRQTPEIPANCQWAIFLRNHDELTLEMVTDKERDLLWEVYAADRRARLNLGIRRRLAPLMERDRRRIELMKCLLLTMPGTPVVYYGDEIGMGDNIHLGDRDGVRTPMQWSSDRNGGFSRVDPSDVILPSIMGPLWGYEAVNVEAQWRDPHSLLNWFRRMLVIRGRYKAFGRGALRFLRPQNRKALAYLREFEGDTILCVANVSRTAQAVELDLTEFAGLTPSELSGGVGFPSIGQLSYLLTLPPYGFYWFSLSKENQPPIWSTATAGSVAEHHTFVLRNNLLGIGEGTSRQMLEQEILPVYINNRRWFQNKGQKIAAIELAAIEPLPGVAGDAIFVQLAVHVGDAVERYMLPLAVAWEDKLQNPFEAPLALARVRQGRRVGLLTDAFATPSFARALLTGLKTSTNLKLNDGGAITFRPTSALKTIRFNDADEIEWPSAEQTNSSLIVGRKAVVKLLRRLTPGTHPEAEMSRFLTDAGFTGSPPLYGDVVFTSADGTSSTCVLVQAFVQNQGDGWMWTLDRLHPLIDEHATPFGDENEGKFENYRAFATTLGRRLGEMHRILAQPSENPDFGPQRVTKSIATEWASATQRQVKHALTLISNRKDDDFIASLIDRRKAILDHIAELAKSALGTMRTRVHGDLHLGQVLVASGDVQIIDFEGEPLKPIEQRRARSSPMKDIAGLIRSFDYAAAVVERESLLTESGASNARAVDLLDQFRGAARDGLLGGYEEGFGAPLSDQQNSLLDLFLLEKAAYEIAYEAANRPDWLSVPTRGLAKTVDLMLNAPQKRTK